MEEDDKQLNCLKCDDKIYECDNCESPFEKGQKIYCITLIEEGGMEQNHHYCDQQCLTDSLADATEAF
jgi:hypothetical protein